MPPPLQRSLHNLVQAGHWPAVELAGVVVVDYLQMTVVYLDDVLDYVDVHVHGVLSPAPAPLSWRTWTT